MYKIIGADGREYGPVTADQIRQWISEGRVNGQTQICAEGTQDWKPLAQFPEFGLTSGPVPAAAPAAPVSVPVTEEEILARDYSLDIGSCIGRGWELFKNNFGALFVAFLLFMLVVIAAGGACQLVMAGVGVNKLPLTTRTYLYPIVTIITSLVVGPVAGGLYYVYLCAIRGETTNTGDLFIGFRSGFQDLFLGKLIPSLIAGLCMLPYNIVSATKMAPFLERIEQQQQPPGNPMEIFSHLGSAFAASLPVLLICMIPALYLYVNWQFTLALIVDKQMGFWTAMKTSWKMVHKHWFHVFGLVVLASIISTAGFLVCCIGVFFTGPIAVAATMYAYEDIFGHKTA